MGAGVHFFARVVKNCHDYFLHGQDSYRSKQKLKEIVEKYKSSKKSGLDLVYIDASKSDFQDFYNNFKTFSMFKEKKLVVLKNLFSSPPHQSFSRTSGVGASKNFQEDFLNEIKKLESMDDVIVVYESDEVDQRLKIFKVLTKDPSLHFKWNMFDFQTVFFYFKYELAIWFMPDGGSS